MSTLRPDDVRAMAADHGFELVRFGAAQPAPADRERFLAWLAANRHGEMEYLRRNAERIVGEDPWVPQARTSITLATDYGGPPVALPGGGKVARYAAGRDYHRHLGKKVQRLRKSLAGHGVPFGSMGGGTDAVPVLERALAVQSGIGFLAKSSMVISPTHGPWLFLAELLTPLELPPDGPAPGTCGTCTACLDACPTDAITAPYEVDARRCISYTTIEHRGFFHESLREAQGEHFFGCDVCVEVCPFTSKSTMATVQGAARPPDLRNHTVVETWSLVDILALDQEAYERDWTGTAMRRATRGGLRRNAAITLANRGDTHAIPHLMAILTDEDPIVRGHAVWALAKLGAPMAAIEPLRNDANSQVRHEVERALAQGH